MPRFGVTKLLSGCTLIFAAIIAYIPAMADGLNFSTSAKSAILLDYTTRSIIYEKNIDERLAPASLTKLMTVAVIFRALKAGEISLDDDYEISKYAWRTGGAPSRTSTMFASVNSKVSVLDLLKGAIIVSGNDACIALAEGYAGSERAFVVKMNAYAKKLELKQSQFSNSTGLDDPAMHISARDVAKITMHIIREFSELYSIFSMKSFEWNNITQKNRNPLFATELEADGLKTGYTKASGYNLASSAKIDGQRLIAVLLGLPSAETRKSDARKLFIAARGAFERIELYGAHEVVGRARVFAGSQGSIPLTSKSPIQVVLPIDQHGEIAAEIEYKGPLIAPVKSETPVGHLNIIRNGVVIQRSPLIASENVERGDFTSRVLYAVREYVYSIL